MSNVPKTNTGHGHVWNRPDGMKARCGGPSMCRECAKDLALVHAYEEREADRRSDALVDLAEWLVSLDDVDGPGAEARRTVTLTQIINRARAALRGEPL